MFTPPSPSSPRKSGDPPFFRVVLAFHSMLTINRHCPPDKILALLRRYFQLLTSTLPLVLHEISTGEEITLTDETRLPTLINPGIFLCLLKHDPVTYHPLMDLRLIPVELLPEKAFLPASIPFVLREIRPFAELLINTIDYMKAYERERSGWRPLGNRSRIETKRESQSQSPLPSISQMSTIKRNRRARLMSQHRYGSSSRSRKTDSPSSVIIDGLLGFHPHTDVNNIHSSRLHPSRGGYSQIRRH